MFEISLHLTKSDVGVVQSMIEGLDNAYCMMGTRSTGDGTYVMVLQASSYMFGELVGVLAHLLTAGHIMKMCITPWTEEP